jgi:hypothetical protein
VELMKINSVSTQGAHDGLKSSTVRVDRSDTGSFSGGYGSWAKR